MTHCILFLRRTRWTLWYTTCRWLPRWRPWHVPGAICSSSHRSGRWYLYKKPPPPPPRLLGFASQPWIRTHILQSPNNRQGRIAVISIYGAGPGLWDEWGPAHLSAEVSPIIISQRCGTGEFNLTLICIFNSGLCWSGFCLRNKKNQMLFALPLSDSGVPCRDKLFWGLFPWSKF